MKITDKIDKYLNENAKEKQILSIYKKHKAHGHGKDVYRLSFLPFTDGGLHIDVKPYNDGTIQLDFKNKEDGLKFYKKHKKEAEQWSMIGYENIMGKNKRVTII